jgi:nucleoredoxin
MPSGQGENFPMNKNILALVAGLTLMPWLTATLKADFFGDLQPKLIESKNGKPVPYEAAETKPEFTAIYYSAHWCPPCRALTPKLVTWYKNTKARFKNFELVFASSDKDEAAMMEYMKEDKMPWPAIRFDEKKSSGVGKYAAGGIPYLVLLDKDGKDLTGLSENEWQHPSKVMPEIEKILLESRKKKE